MLENSGNEEENSKLQFHNNYYYSNDYKIFHKKL